VCRFAEYSRRVSGMWIVFLAALALTAVYFGEVSVARQHPVQAAPTLTPGFSLPGGYYDRDIQLEMDAPFLDGKRCEIVFTTDGITPTLASGTVYTRPILLRTATKAVTVIRARAVLPNGSLGPVVSASYLVGVPATLPIMSLIVAPDDLWDPERGIHANPQQRGDAWERPVDITYVDKNRDSGFQISGGIRIHGLENRESAKKSFRLYFRQEYGAARLEYPLFVDDSGVCSHVCSFKRLVLHSGGQDVPAPFPGIRQNWTLIRNQLTDRLALQIGGYASRSQPTLLFINGEPWGIYQIRERLDRYFLADHFGVLDADLIKAPEFEPGESIPMGDSEHWDHLLRFVETHDLSDPTHYAYIQSQVDIANLIDYTILQIYIANTDWPHHNVEQFRPRVQGGRWHWLFWDSDHGFAAYPMPPRCRVDSDMIRHILSFNHFRTGGRDLLLLRKLLENPVFFERFLSRTADLLNTTLVPQSVIAHIDALAAELEPDIAHESVRWPGGMDWASNIQELRDFAYGRPDFVRQHIVRNFGLQGTIQLTFDSPGDGAGYLSVNGTLVQDLPWQGAYFHGTHVRIIAVPAPGYRFAGWSPADLAQAPAITLTVSAAQTIAPRFERIDERVPRAGDVVFADRSDSAQETWFELSVVRSGGVDLSGWRITDNDTKTATDEGSLVFADIPSLARVPRGTTIRVVVTWLPPERPRDDLYIQDRQLVLYVGNDSLDTSIDPGFSLGPDDNLVLLAPGPTKAFTDDRGIAFSANGSAVTPASFGVLSDGVLP
jgi:hypothetical protein